MAAEDNSICTKSHRASLEAIAIWKATTTAINVMHKKIYIFDSWRINIRPVHFPIADSSFFSENPKLMQCRIASGSIPPPSSTCTMGSLGNTTVSSAFSHQEIRIIKIQFKIPWNNNAGLPSLGFMVLSTMTKVAPFWIYPIKKKVKLKCKTWSQDMIA